MIIIKRKTINILKTFKESNAFYIEKTGLDFKKILKLSQFLFLNFIENVFINRTKNKGFEINDILMLNKGFIINIQNDYNFEFFSNNDDYFEFLLIGRKSEKRYCHIIFEKQLIEKHFLLFNLNDLQSLKLILKSYSLRVINEIYFKLPRCEFCETKNNVNFIAKFSKFLCDNCVSNYCSHCGSFREKIYINNKEYCEKCYKENVFFENKSKKFITAENLDSYFIQKNKSIYIMNNNTKFCFRIVTKKNGRISTCSNCDCEIYENDKIFIDNNKKFCKSCYSKFRKYSMIKEYSYYSNEHKSNLKLLEKVVEPFFPIKFNVGLEYEIMLNENVSFEKLFNLLNPEKYNTKIGLERDGSLDVGGTELATPILNNDDFNQLTLFMQKLNKKKIVYSNDKCSCHMTFNLDKYFDVSKLTNSENYEEDDEEIIMRYLKKLGHYNTYNNNLLFILGVTLPKKRLLNCYCQFKISSTDRRSMINIKSYKLVEYRSPEMNFSAKYLKFQAHLFNYFFNFLVHCYQNKINFNNDLEKINSFLRFVYKIDKKNAEKFIATYFRILDFRYKKEKEEKDDFIKQINILREGAKNYFIYFHQEEKNEKTFE